MKLVARIQLSPNALFDDLCVLSKNLYNRANFLIRQEFITNAKWARYNSLYQKLRTEPCYQDFQALAESHAPQQTLRTLDRNWKSFFQSIKDWKKNPNKYKGRPNLPHYLRKDGKFHFVWTKLQSRVKDSHFLLLNSLMKKGFPKITIDNLKVDENNYQGARLIPFHDKYMFEMIYNQDSENTIQKKGIMGIDVGLQNLIASSDGLLIKGKVVKSNNQYYNKQLAKCKSLAKKCNGIDYTTRIQRLHRIRYNKIHDYFHKCSRNVIDHCIQNNTGTIIIGYNELWKQNSNLGKRNDQNFVQVPFYKLIHLIKYKAELEGIKVKKITEEYTSQTCSKCGIVRKSNRVSRGLYVCRDCGNVMNADINASINILKKGISESTMIGNRGCLNHPDVLISS